MGTCTAPAGTTITEQAHKAGRVLPGFGGTRVRLSLVLAASACGGSRSPTRPAPEVDCLTWLGPAVQVSPDDARTRHHPTLDALPDGGWLIGWQIGRATAQVAVRSFDADLRPRSAEHVLSGADARATHPQLAVDGERRVLGWTDDATGAFRVRTLLADGAPDGPARTIHAERSVRPALYPDLLWRGPSLAGLWFDGQDPATWSVWADPDVAPVPLRSAPGRGGPGTLRVATDDRLWLAWGEQHPTLTGRRTVRVVTPWPPPDRTPTSPGEQPGRWERPALAPAPDGGLVAAWTVYPSGTPVDPHPDWGVWIEAVAPDGSSRAVPRRLDGQAGRMVDLDAVAGVGVAAWEEPQGSSTDILVAVVDATTGAARCPVTRAHAPSATEEARAAVRLLADPEGVRGLLIWHTSVNPGRQAIHARPFRVM